VTLIRLQLLLLIVAAFSACGDGEERPVPTSSNEKAVLAKNEIVPLRLKSIERQDRLPPNAQNDRAATEIELGSSLVQSEIGSDWASEQFAQVVQNQLNGGLKGLLAEGFFCSDLRPSIEGTEVAGAKIRRFVGDPDTDLATMSEADLLAKIRPFGKLKFKVVGMDLGGEANQFSTRVRASAGAYTGIWSCLWTREEKPRLVEIRLVEYEEVESDGAWFSDVTQHVIGGSARFEAQVQRGVEYWAQRITRIGDFAMTGHHGLAVGDVNGDGLEDLYVCDGGSLPNQLYIQQTNGTAVESAAQWGVDWLEDSRSALLVDLDNDGDQDLVVATIAMIVFAENDGAGKFVLRGGYPGAPYPFSLSAADYDNDRDLDIYACVYGAGDEALSGRRGFEAQSPIPFNDAENGGRNVLLQNLGDFRFGDVTDAVGLGTKNSRWSFSAAWEDYDRDGDSDLYVANDFGRNCFYRNDGGIFSEVSPEVGIEDMGAGMSVAWGDYNRDGDADLYVGNMSSAAGNRVGFQEQFGAGKDERSREGLRRMAKGNSLFAGGESFSDVSGASGAMLGHWAWSSGFADLNNDGWQDIVVANGYLTNTRSYDL